MSGLILFGHGARDPRWAEPFLRLQALVEAGRPDLRVRLAFLEFMTPGLAAAAEALVAEGCRTVRIVPVFLGQGGHVRADVPPLVLALAARHPAVSFDLRPAIGEDEAVLAAIASVCTRDLADPIRNE